MNPGTVTVQRISRNACYQPRLPDSAHVAVRGNTVYKVIHPGSTSSRTRNPPEEWLFRRELQAPGPGSHRRNGFPLGITSSWARNPPEEWTSTRNHLLIDADSGQEDQNARKILQTVTIPGSVVPKCSLQRMSAFLKFKYENDNKIKNKLYPALVRTL
jgi:hypothetical protein